MSDLRQFIEAVLAKRQAQTPKLEAVQRNLRDLAGGLGQLRCWATEACAGEDAPPELRQRMESLAEGVAGLEGRINDALARSANLLARFGKTTINIGVAGKARQGKSTILQAISGLDGRVIPSSPGLPCTGAKSRILHRTDGDHAEIEFYTAPEFLREIVHAYYEELRLPNPPATLNEFERNFPSEPEFERPEEHALYARLKGLRDGMAAYREYLSRPPQRVGLDEVRDYVTQEDGRRRCVAVKCANIFVPFPNGDVTGLAVVDLPGLGEIAKGHSEKLVASLQSDIDAVILVKRPPPSDDWFADDIKVFNEVKKAVPELDLADWLFVVLNIDEDDANADMVRILKARPLHIGSTPRVLSVNCRQSGAVRDDVFMKVLGHLRQNLERIDRLQTSALAGRLTRVADEAVDLVQPVLDYFQKNTIGLADYAEFRKRFDAFWRELTGNLQELTNECRRCVRDAGALKQFEAAVDEACDAARKCVPVPSEDELKGKFNSTGGWPAVVQEELHHLRSYLTHRLADVLDRRLKQLIDGVRGKAMARILAGPLVRLLPPDDREATEPQRRLEAFRRLLDPDGQSTLVAGIDHLLTFSFAYQSHFHFRVREAMNPLDPTAVRAEGEDDPIAAIAPREGHGRYADEAARGLRSFYERVVWNVRKRLREEEGDPMRALFAMAEETRDRLVRARESEGQWERLLYPRRAEVWPEAFSPFGVESARREQWRKGVEAVKHCSERLRSALP